MNNVNLLSGIKRLSDLPDPPEPEMRFEKDGVVLFWGGYDYFIERERINSPESLIAWIDHLAGKSWMNGWRLHQFIQRVVREYDIPVDWSA